FPRGGFHVLRRGPVEVAISCGRNGQGGIGGHSHNDKLAFELRVGGALAICDPGSPSYASDPELRDRFRATRAHATLCVDGEEQAPIPPGRPFALPDAAQATCLVLESARRRERFVGEHRGYARLGIVHRRELLLLDDALVVADRLDGTGTHAVELRFPFPSREARLRPLRRGELRRIEALGDGSLFDVRHAVEVGPAAAPLAVLAVAIPSPLAARLEEAAYSRGYAEVAASLTAVFAGRLRCPATMVTLVLPLGGAAGS
ncbi:MAG TPA: heparinase II/III-family protein, partial [Anaeromyxobacteraceae bacterium]